MPLNTFEHAIFGLSFQIEASASGKQFYPMYLNTAGGVSLMSATAQDCLGVLQDDATTGFVGNVMLQGVSRLWVYGGSTNIAPGDWLTVSATGVGVKSAAAAAAPTIGRALEAAADGTNVIIAVLLQQGRL